MRVSNTRSARVNRTPRPRTRPRVRSSRTGEGSGGVCCSNKIYPSTKGYSHTLPPPPSARFACGGTTALHMPRAAQDRMQEWTLVASHGRSGDHHCGCTTSVLVCCTATRHLTTPTTAAQPHRHECTRRSCCTVCVLMPRTWPGAALRARRYGGVGVCENAAAEETEDDSFNVVPGAEKEGVGMCPSDLASSLATSASVGSQRSSCQSEHASTADV
jgi:hypothetical protein